MTASEAAKIDALEALDRQLTDLQGQHAIALDRLHLALGVACIGVWDWNIAAELDANGAWQVKDSPERSLEWDATMFCLFECDPSTWAGTYKAFADLLNPDDAKLVEAKIRRCIATREPYDYSYRTRNGKRIHGCGKCYYGTDGRPERFIGVCLQAPSPVTVELPVQREPDNAKAD